MSDTDGLAAETRQLLDAATPGPWHCVVDDSAGKDQLELWCDYDDGSWREGMTAPFHLDPFCYDPTPMERATAALIAAAPRLLANWLARNEQTEAVEDDLGRIANENAALAGRLMAERDRLADENRALREAIRTHEDLHRPVGPDSPNGPIHMDGWPCCDDDRHLWAAADRGVTDGDRNEGERT